MVGLSEFTVLLNLGRINMTKEELKDDIRHHEFVLKQIQSKWCDWSITKQNQNYPIMMSCINRINWAKNKLRLEES